MELSIYETYMKGTSLHHSFKLMYLAFILEKIFYQTLYQLVVPCKPYIKKCMAIPGKFNYL